MKKIVYAIAALALIFTGCAKELENTTRDNFSKVRLHVKVADQLTKVSADNDGRYHWQAHDKISVLNNAGKAFEFETEEGGNDVDFSGTISTGTLGSYAMYPSVSTNEAAENVVSFHLPTSIDWVANATNMPMLGKIAENKATFRSVGGVLKLVCYNIPSGAAWLQFTATNKQIVGKFMIDGSESLPVLEATNTDKAGEKELSIDFSSDYSANKVFYIPLPTGTIDGFTVAFLDSEFNELFSKTTVASPTVSRNQMILAPALNCSTDVVLWRESFAGYSADTKWTSSASIQTGVGYDAEAFGDASVTYLSDDGTSAYGTKVVAQNNAGGVSPEINIGNNNGFFQASGIPTNGAETMLLTFKENADVVTVTSSTANVTITDKSFASKTYTATVNNPDKAATIDLKFAVGTTYARFDNVSLIIEAASSTVPVITSDNVNLTIGIGQLSKSTSVGITNPVDGLGLSYVLSKKDDKPMDWISSVVISEETLTVTATDANGEAEDREAILTLKATGAADKVINLKQTSALVQRPASITTLPGNASMSASWTKAAHATGYLAYLCESTGLADPTGGIELTPSIDGSTVSVSKPSGLTNGTTYYLYVKVNTVDTNYIADSEWTEKSVTPENVIYYTKITSAGDIETGVKYLLVYETGNKAFDGGLDVLDASNNTIEVAISDGKIVANSSTNSASFIIDGDTDAYTIKSASGKYIGRTASSNGLDSDDSEEYTNRISFSSSNVVIVGNNGEGNATTAQLQVYGGNRFRYYTSSQSAIQLYKYDDPRTSPGLVWKKSGVEAGTDTASMETGDDTMPTITLDNPHDLTLTYSSSKPSVATINASTGAISLVGVGSTVITAAYTVEDNPTYRPQRKSYTLTVSDNRETPVITLDTSDAEYNTDNYGTFLGRSATVDKTVSLTYEKSDPASIINEFNTSTGALTLSGNTGSATVTVSFAGNAEYKPAISQSYMIKVTSSSGAEPLPAPASAAITDISISGKTFSASWATVTNAISYDWIVSTASDEMSITSGNTKASGNTSSITVTTSALDDSHKPVPGTTYYLYVKAKGDGLSYADSDYIKVRGTMYEYVFTSKAWAATLNGSESNWASSKDGNALTSGQGIQITTSVSGANGTSPISYTNVSKITVTYCTNASKGEGTLKAKVGTGTEKTFSVTKPASGGTTLKNTSWSFSPNESGSVKITAECTTNSVYVYGVSILAE